MRTALVVALAAIALAGCRQTKSISEEEGVAAATGLERRIERFSQPDRYGVVCYQDVLSSGNLSCVQVTGTR